MSERNSVTGIASYVASIIRSRRFICANILADHDRQTIGEPFNAVGRRRTP